MATDEKVGVPKFRSFEPHPLLGMFPTGTVADVQAMKLSVQRTGVQHRLRVWKDPRNKYWLIDGTVRQAGAELAFKEKLAHDPPEPTVADNGVDLQPEVDEFVGTTDEVYAFIKTTHCRKNYEPGQKAAMGVRLYYYEYKKAHSGKLPDVDAEVSGEGALTAVELAAMYAVNEYYIRICRQLYRDAPDLLDAVAFGTLSPPKAMAALKKKRAGDAPSVPGDEDDGGEAGGDEDGKYYDDEGTEVPDVLLPAWQAKGVFKQLRVEVTGRRADAAVLAASEAGASIDGPVLDKQFAAALSHMHGAEPMRVCPDCDGHKRRKGQRWECKRCVGRGFLTREDLKMMKRAASQDGAEPDPEPAAE